MNADPTPNNPNDPPISILVYNYDRQYLRQCLDSIFNQDILTNYEVILIDDATNDGSWDTALEFLHKYPKRITVNRNRRAVGPEINFCHCEKMAKGGYAAILTNDQALLPDYIKSCVQNMSSDPYVRFSLVCRIPKQHMQPPGMLNKPLVSILCYNYNYGRYLRQCLESVFSQTYENIELCFSDNASTDESWDIALECAHKHPGMMTITRNRKNFGSDANLANCMLNARGKYFIELCSDDALMPGYVKRCVDALEAHPTAGFAMVHRTIVDEYGRRTEEPPFYNQSCLIPGPDQAAVYMMAAVNPSISQVMYNTNMANGKSAAGGIAARWYGTRIQDFNMCCEFDMLYIKEPLLMHRLHSQNDSSRAAGNLIEVIGPYVLQHQFAEIASCYNHTRVVDRLPQALDKLSHLCLRYCVRFLCENDEKSALRYFHLAVAIMPDITSDSTFERLKEYWSSDALKKLEIVESLKCSDNLANRTVSYNPPPGSIPIDANP